jgi:SAM-dependent methyltransferase
MSEQAVQGLSDKGVERSHFASNARFVPDYGLPAIRLLQPVIGERILDLGCGDGSLTREFVSAGAIPIGVDVNATLIDLAKRRGVDARVTDATRLTFQREFDAVFSNAALHYMLPMGEVARGVARALVPGGRFVGELGAHGNIAAISTALLAVIGRYTDEPGDFDFLPWHFPTADEYCDVLEEAGFSVETILTVPRPTPLPQGLTTWLDTFAGWCFDKVPDAQKQEAREYITKLLRPSLQNRHGEWIADYVRLRFRARLSNAS